MPALGGVYKLAAVIEDGEIIPKIKLSDNSAKITNPGFKTIYRIYGKDGMAEADLIALRGETFDTSKPLTIVHPVERWKKLTFEPGEYTMKELPIKVIENGKLVGAMPPLKEIVAYAKKEKETFWDEYKRIDKPHIYKVDLSDELYTLKTNMINAIRRG